MNLSKFFIDRPIFAGVLSVLRFVAGLLALVSMPVSEYPEVVPPSIVVRAQYPGASPKVIAETVATPIEEAINGVENMLYMSSQATTDGLMTLTVTFRLGTDADKAQQLVQNRVAQAEARLPADVRALGVTTVKSSADLMMVVHVLSPNDRYDVTYLRNYAVLNVKDRLARIPGVGDVQIFGAGDYSMRVWLDPDKVAAHGLSATDVVAEIRAQNVQAAAGVVGGAPSVPGLDLQLSVNAQGRLLSEEEFGAIVVKSGPNGEITRLSDIARPELGASSYALRSLLDNKPAVAVPVFQAPASNAIQISDRVREVMAESQETMPEGVEYRIVYDTTRFVRASIRAVVETLFEAIALVVVVVVVVFLQTWRASIIPLLAVPVSIVGTFAVMYVAGFSVNALTLFGLVLAIGIVVDDAIVVVENVERNIEQGHSPREATYRATREVSGPIVAIALVLVAVFVPLAFITGLTGQFYRQFALATLLLRGHDAPKDRLGRIIGFALGWFFRGFNAVFRRGSAAYGASVGRVARHKSLAMAVYAVLLGGTWMVFQAVPGGFVPGQDKQYLVGFVQWPDGATLDRTEEVIRRMGEIALAFPGLSINGFTNGSNAGIVFVVPKDFEKRRSRAGRSRSRSTRNMPGSRTPSSPCSHRRRCGASAPSAASSCRSRIAPDAATRRSPGSSRRSCARRPGAGTGAAVLRLADRRAAALRRRRPGQGASARRLGHRRVRGHADLSRFALRQRLQPLRPDLFGAGAGRRAVPRPARRHRQTGGEVEVGGDDPAVGFARGAAGRRSRTGDARQRLPRGRRQRRRGARLLHRSGPGGGGADRGGDPAQGLRLRMDGTHLPTDHRRQFLGDRLPAGAAARVPGARRAIREPRPADRDRPDRADGAARGADGRVAVGRRRQHLLADRLGRSGRLSAKNAILIVEFARELEFAGRTPIAAAIEASRLRLRPILMTSLAFVMGALPLVTSTGAGAEMRRAVGVAVFSGMIGVTVFGLVLTPVFSVVIRALTGDRPLTHHHVSTIEPEHDRTRTEAAEQVRRRARLADTFAGRSSKDRRHRCRAKVGSPVSFAVRWSAFDSASAS